MVSYFRRLILSAYAIYYGCMLACSVRPDFTCIFIGFYNEFRAQRITLISHHQQTYCRFSTPLAETSYLICVEGFKKRIGRAWFDVLLIDCHPCTFGAYEIPLKPKLLAKVDSILPSLARVVVDGGIYSPWLRRANGTVGVCRVQLEQEPGTNRCNEHTTFMNMTSIKKLF